VPYSGEAQFQPSYKGVIAVAKRTGQILDISGDVICQNDRWHFIRKGGEDDFEHERPPLGTPRGETIGAYMKLVLPNNLWRVEVMDIDELDRIMKRSKAFKKGNSPWHTDRAEMQKKTVVHRALKTYCDDPGLIVALEAMETEYDDEPPRTSTKVGRSAINDRLGIPAASGWPAQDDDPFRGQQAPQDAAEGVDDEPADDGKQDAGDPLAGLHEALAACKTKSDCQAVAKRFYKPGLSDEQINEVSAACDERADTLPDAAKGKQKTFNE